MDVTSAIPWVVVNLFFACLALGLGFISGAFWFGGKRPRSQQEESSDAEQMLQKRIAMDRAVLASGQLQDLASGVACQVGDHSRQVQEISLSLRQAESDAGVVPQQLLGQAMSQLLEANDTLQNRLEKAEKQIKAQALEIAEHESEARTDSLTELSNRRAFDDELGRRFAEWQRKGTPFCLTILDVDHFKKFNDTHGHQVGDEVLKRVAHALRASTRAMDIPCRYGGEEFAVVLPDTKLQDAAALAERIRIAIASEAIECDGEELSVTASFGVAEAQDADDAKLLLRRADEALYEAKDAGRNRGYFNAMGANQPIQADGKAPSASEAEAAKPLPLKLLDKLPNRSVYINQLARRVAETCRTNQPVAVFTVRVEGFQRMKNDYSEAVATLTLDAVALFLQKTLRDMDLLARVADDRFAVMLPGAGVEEAKLVSERACTALTSCAVPIGSDHIQLDARFACTEFTSSDSAPRMLERAEKALDQPAEDATRVLVS